MAVHPERQGLESLQEEERVEGGERGAEVAQELHAELDDERRRPLDEERWKTFADSLYFVNLSIDEATYQAKLGNRAIVIAFGRQQPRAMKVER